MTYYLIDNFMQKLLEFDTLKKLKKYAETTGFKPKKSPISDNSYWLDNAF